MNQPYISLNAKIDALYTELHAMGGDEFDAQAYDRASEELASLQNDRDELLAGLLLEQYNQRFTIPIDRSRALVMARHANEQRDNRLYLKEV